MPVICSSAPEGGFTFTQIHAPRLGKAPLQGLTATEVGTVKARGEALDWRTWFFCGLYWSGRRHIHHRLPKTMSVRHTPQLLLLTPHADDV